jgi:predicted flap endonuclease-1-like 5' DNA nuclease
MAERSSQRKIDPGAGAALPSRRAMAGDLAANLTIAERFREAATLLGAQGANSFRVAAYRRAADTVAALEEPVAGIAAREGLDGLDGLHGIGPALAAAIMEMVSTGRWRALEGLRGEADPERLLQTVPGIGPVLAATIHENLGIETLEALELAAHDGRLEALKGLGSRRTAIIRDSLNRMLGRVRPGRPAGPMPRADEPPVDMLLDVDREYRAKAEGGELRTMAPRRFNPGGEAWLPILHTERGPFQFTVLFSNTARAHDLGRTRDWVVMFYHTDHQPERQCTVVTETRGELAGRRVVRGREAECREVAGARDG